MLESHFVRIKGIHGAEEAYLPLDLDNTLSFELLLSQFPYATGLKCVNKKKENVRTVRKSGGRFFLSHDEKWDEMTFYCAVSRTKKRIILESELTGVRPKQKETIQSIHSKFPITFDLLAIGLSFDTTEEELCKYLGRFGKLLYCKLKVHEVTLQSKGTAYFRFKEAKDQSKCLNATHLVDKTKIIIKIPKEKVVVKENYNFKLYLFNISSNITREDLRTYFSQFGLVVNLFKPYDHRNFAFITFDDQHSVDRVLASGHHHTFNGGRVSVNLVVPKEDLLKGVKPSLKNSQINNNTLKRSNNNINAICAKKHVGPYPSIEIKREEPSQNVIDNYHNGPSNHVVFNKIPREYNALCPPPNYFTPANFFYSSFHGDNSTSLTQSPYFPSTSSSVPFYNTNICPQSLVPPSFQNNQQFQLSYQHPRKVSTPSLECTKEDKSQLKSLVNMFIQEIRNNFDSLSKS